MGRFPARIFRKKGSKDMSEGTYLGEKTMGAPTSRRKFLAGSAAALAGGALMAVPGAALADNHKGKKHRVTDVEILNYALTLEHLEATFYTQGLKEFDKGDFEKYFKNNKPYRKQGIKDLDGGAIYEEFVRIREHEQTHVKTLEAVLGKKAVPKSTYNFDKTAFTSIGKFLAVAEFLENTGVSAYDGAIAYIKAAKLQTAGATIATVEARHASYLNLINGDEPFPKPFDKPVAPRKICEAVQAENGGFIVRSPKPYGPYKSLDALCARLPNTVIAP
jgi:rubrerythrin